VDLPARPWQELAPGRGTAHADRFAAAERDRDDLHSGAGRPPCGGHPRVRFPDVRGQVAEGDAHADPRRRFERRNRSPGARALAARTAKLDHRPRVALLEWLDPPFSCGHWTPELVRLAGGVEGLGQEGRPSRTLAWSEVIAWQPEIVFIACCGFGVERTLQDL